MLSSLSVLRDSELIYDRGIYPNSIYIFRHAFTQEVAYHSLLLKRRKNIHEKIGNAIESLYSERLADFCEILAYHYQQADNQRKELEYLRMAAKKAAKKFASEEGIVFCEKALKIFDNLVATEENQKLRREIELLLLEIQAISGEIAPI